MNITELIQSYRENSVYLGERHTGGTSVNDIERLMPAFAEVMEIANPSTMLEIGFNAGNASLIFLTIDPELILDSVDIVMNEKSAYFLWCKFPSFRIHDLDSKLIEPNVNSLYEQYDLIFIDGDHTYEGVIADIESSLKFKPKYLLFDDVRHPSHGYIEEIINVTYAEKMEMVKLWEFNDIWQGYTFALCKVK